MPHFLLPRLAFASGYMSPPRPIIPLKCGSIEELPDRAVTDSRDKGNSLSDNPIPEHTPKMTAVPGATSQEAQSTDHKFGISLVACRTSCCFSLVHVEQVSDWLHGISSSFEGSCPSCLFSCTFDKILASPQSSSPKIHRKSSLRISLPGANNRPYPSPSGLSRSAPPSARRVRFDLGPVPPSTSSTTGTPSSSTSDHYLFNTDGESYPETEHAAVLRSRPFSADLYEMSIRLASIACLTFLLYALLSRPFPE